MTQEQTTEQPLQFGAALVAPALILLSFCVSMLLRVCLRGLFGINEANCESILNSRILCWPACNNQTCIIYHFAAAVLKHLLYITRCTSLTKYIVMLFEYKCSHCHQDQTFESQHFSEKCEINN